MRISAAAAPSGSPDPGREYVDKSKGRIYLRRMEWRINSPKCFGDEHFLPTVQNCISSCSATLTATGVSSGIAARTTRTASVEIVGCSEKSLDVLSVKDSSSGISVDKIPKRRKQVPKENNSREKSRPLIRKLVAPPNYSTQEGTGSKRILCPSAIS
jgi:hypothetical protein